MQQMLCVQWWWRSWNDDEVSIKPEEEIVEEVEVEARLDDSAAVHDPVVHVSFLVISAVNPVADVQRAISSEEEDVVACQILHFTVSLQRYQLRDNG